MSIRVNPWFGLSFICLLLALSALLLPSCGGKSGGATGPGSYGTSVEKVRAFGIEISPDGSTLYLANNVRGEIEIMNTATMHGAGTYMVSPNYGLQYLKYDSANNRILAMHRRVEGVQKFFVYDIPAGETTVDLEWDYSPSDKLGVDSKTFAYADGMAYIANKIGNIVIADVSSAAAATVTGTPMLANAFGTALNSSASTLYASLPSTSGTNSVYVYSTADNSQLANVTLTGCLNATHIILDETRDNLYVSCTNSKKVITVDTSANSLVAGNFAVGNKPYNLAMTEDERYLFVSNQNDDTVSMIDLDTGAVVKTFQTGDLPAGIAVYDPFIYVTNALEGTVTKIDYTAASTARGVTARIGSSWNDDGGAADPIGVRFRPALTPYR